MGGRGASLPFVMMTSALCSVLTLEFSNGTDVVFRVKIQIRGPCAPLGARLVWSLP